MRLVGGNTEFSRIFFGTDTPVAGRSLAEIGGSGLHDEVSRAAADAEPSTFEFLLPGRSGADARLRITVSRPPAGSGVENLRVLAVERISAHGDSPLDHLPDIYLEALRDGTIVKAAIPESERPAWALERAPGRPLRQAVPAEVASLFEQALERAIDRGEVQGFVFTLRSSVEARLYEARIIRSGEGRGVALIRNVTHDRRLRHAVEQLAAIVENSHDVIYSISLDGTIVSWNHGAESIYGYSAAEALGRPMSVLLPPDRASDMDEILRIVRMGGRIERFPTTRLRKDGRRVEIELSVSPLRDTANGVYGASLIARDITEYRRLDRAFREAGERERRRLCEDLHEGLGQELAGIALACNALASRLGREHREEARRIGQLVGKAIDATRSLAQALYPVGLKDTDLPEYLRHIATFVERTFGVTCTVDWDPNVLIPGEPAARNVYWIVQEAVTNAVRHGGPRHIRIHGSLAGGIRVTVRDDGKGLGAGHEGMGILVMKSRARSIGAELTVSNHDEGGVAVEFVLPAATSPGRPLEEAS